MIPDLPPYAQLLGLSAARDEEGVLVWTMPFTADVLGRPGFLHGGAIAGLLEFAALGAVQDALEGQVRLKPINVTVEYMRGGIDHPTCASAVVTRLGTRIANVEARAWQEDRTRPIASAQMNVLLRR